MFEFTHGMVVSLDGQTVRASFERATELSPVHLVSAWCSQHGGLVMGQLKTESKSNDITAIPELLMLRQNRSKSISLRQKRLLCSLDEDYLLQAISGAT